MFQKWRTNKDQTISELYNNEPETLKSILDY